MMKPPDCWRRSKQDSCNNMILIVSYPGEEHTVEVVQRLEQRGREVHLLDLAEFPAKSLAFSWPNTHRGLYTIDNHLGSIDLRKVGVGWWRRIRPFCVDDKVGDPSARAFVESETSQAVCGMLDALGCQWVNDRAADDKAQHKPYQWAVANQIGLNLPRTLVTNKPEEARRFIEEIGIGKVIFKAFLASYDAWRETRLVMREDVDKLELVRYAPVIFQEYIEGVDLRITAIGDKLFPAEIDARKTSYPVDMRMVVGESDVKAVRLPSKVEKALLKLQHELGLSFGAIDMRRTSDGKYYFFEVNPAGQWLFVEQRSGLAISDAMADHLSAFDEAAQMGRSGQ